MTSAAKPKPLLTAGESRAYPVLPLRDIVVFPHMIVPLFVGREKSIKALEEVMRSDTFILLATQKNASDDDPATDSIFTVGTLASVLQLLKLPDGTVKVLVEGAARARVTKYTDREEYYEAEAVVLADTAGEQVEAEALARSVINEFEGYVKLNKKVSPEVVGVVQQIEDYAKLADTVASHLAVKIPDKQVILETPSVTERLEKVLGLMESEISVLQVEKRIRTRVKRQMEKTQREYYLNEQMKAIQKELGDEDGKDEVAELEDKIKRTKLSKEAREKAQHEIKKLRQMSPMSAEATVVRNYLDWLLSIPWNKKSKIKKDLTLAEQILDADHFGLEKVKERIVEYLAVQQRANKLTGPILCLVGPPGVGKTSLGKSIAKATGREFVRVSLGGVRDEAEIRGHRRTYIGSMPGKVIQSMRKAKTSNPLFLLDEVDKMGADFRGDPSSALLEVLDPEQNHAFNDHYLEVDYDLSNVMFITTANTLNIPPPLMDRMEIIRIAGYTEDEKVEIARKHLIPHAIVKHGLEPKEWSIDDEALLTLIRRYTREAGVRNLERELSTLDPQGGEGTDDLQEGIGSGHRQGHARLSRRAKIPLWRGRGRGPGRCGHRAGLDRRRRRASHHRGGHDARQGQDDRHRQLARRDEGIDLGGGVLRPHALGRLRHRAAGLRQARHPRARAGRRHAEGWAVRGRRHGHRHRLGDDRHRGASRRRHDRRDHAARPRAADRRLEGEALGRTPRRHQDRAHSGRERQGSCRDQRQHQERARHHSGLAHGRGLDPRAGEEARADHLGRGDRQAGRCPRPGGRGRRLGPYRALTAVDETENGALAGAVFSWATRRYRWQHY